MNSRITSLFAATCVTLIGIFALSADSTPTPYTWAQTYGVGSFNAAGDPANDRFYGSGTDYPVGMAQMPDGGVVVAGQLDLPKLYAQTYVGHTGGYADATLVRYNSDGTVAWQKTLHQNNDRSDGTYYSPAPSRVYQVATDADGNIFICGGKGNPDNSGQLPFVAKLSAAGDLIWQKGITGATATVNNLNYQLGVGQANYMCLTSDGGVLITGTESRPDQPYTIPTLTKFDKDGNLALYAAYEHPHQYAASFPVAELSNGNYVFLQQGPSNGFATGFAALVVDPSGTLLAQKSFDPDYGFESGRAIVPTSDGGFTAMTWISGPTAADAFIVRKFNADLTTEVFSKRIRPSRNNAVFTASSMKPLSDGGFLIGGHGSAYGEGTGGGFYEAALVKLQSDGTLQSVSLLGGPNDERFNDNITEGCDAVATTDGGFAFTIATYSYSIDAADFKPDWWVVKTDANRKVTGFGGLMLDQALNEFTVTDLTDTLSATQGFSRVSYSVTPTVSSEPSFQIQDVGSFTGINKPTANFQATTAGGPTPTPTQTCSPGWADCSGTGICVDLNSDSNNCGTCGNSCPPGTTCGNGTCIPVAPTLSISAKATTTSDPLSGRFAHTGDKIDYVITYANSGGNIAPDLRVSATIPSYVENQTNIVKQFTAAQLQISPGWTYVPASSPQLHDAKLVWNVGGLGSHLENSVRFTILALPSFVRTEQYLVLPNDYSVYSGPTPGPNPVTGFSSGAAKVETHIEGAIKTTLTGPAKVAPGGDIVYTFKVTNTAAPNSQTPPHAIAVMVQPEFTNFSTATITKPGGVTFTPVTKLVYVSGQTQPQLLMDLGPIAGGKTYSAQVTFGAAWADPAEVLKISTMDYGASFLPETTAYQTFKSAFAAGKKNPPGGSTDFMSFVTSSLAVASSRQDSGQVDVTLQGSLAKQPLLELNKSISNSVNGTQGNGSGRATDFIKPGDQVTFILTAENRGRTTATDVFIQDGLPEHTTFVSATRLVFVPPQGTAKATFIAQPFVPTLDNQSGHHIRFEGLKLAPGERLMLTYTVRVDSGAAAPEAGSFINSDASSIGSANTLHTPPGFYQNGPIQIIGNALVLAEPKSRPYIASPEASHDAGATADVLTAIYRNNPSAQPIVTPGNAPSYVPGVQRYYAHYENAGTTTARFVRMTVGLPAHTVFYRAAFVSLPASTSGQLGKMPGTVLTGSAIPKGGTIINPSFLSSGGNVVFNLDKLGAGEKGDVMVEVIVTDDAIQLAGSLIGGTDVTIEEGATSAPISAAASASSAAAPQLSASTSSRSKATLSFVPLSAPGQVPKVGILKTVPTVVLPSSTYDVYITIFNRGEYAAETPLVNFTVPQGTTFVQASYGEGRFFNNSNSSAPGSVMSFFMASNNGKSYGLEPLTYLDPHTAASIKITLRVTAPVGSTINDSRTDLLVKYAGECIAPPSSTYVTSSLTGLVDQNGPGRWSTIVGGTGYQLLFNGGGIDVVDIGGGNIVAQGAGNIVAQGAGNVGGQGGGIVAQGAGNIVAQGAGNLIPIGVTNGGTLLNNISGIVAQGAGNIIGGTGSSIVAQGGGNIVAAGAGNIVAQGAGNIVAQGAGNMVAQGAGNAISLPVAGLVGSGAGQIVAQGAGNIVAQGAGNIVAQGAGNIVAAGAGNIISGNGSAVMASTPESSAMVRLGGNIISTGGGGIVAQGAGN